MRLEAGSLGFGCPQEKNRPLAHAGLCRKHGVELKSALRVMLAE